MSVGVGVPSCDGLFVGVVLACVGA